MDQEPFQSLPRGWGIATLDEVALWGSGGTPSRKNPKFYEGSIPWVKTGELGPKYIRSAEEHITQEAIQRSSAKVFPPGSVGIAMYGATIGKLSIWAADLSTNQACAVAQPYQELFDTEFLYYFLLSQKRALIEAGKGGAQPNISQGILKAWPTCLPPLNEQRRIVAKIEELFSELDKGVESLKTARAQLNVYRQAVLKHAFEGKLTAQWREENKDKLETPEQLLARIEQERAARYEQQLKEWKIAVKKCEGSGKSGKKPAEPKKPLELADVPQDVIAKLPHLPEGWLWAHLGDISDVSGGLTKNQKRNSLPRKMKYLRVANVYADEILTDDIHEIGVTDSEAKAVALEAGDLLIVEGNGSIGQIGRVALWDGELSLCGHQNHLIRTRLLKNFLPRFFLQFLLSPLGRDLIVREASSTSGLHTLSISKVSNLVVPVASSAEESAVVAQIEERLSKVDKTLEDIDTQLVMSEALRQSILKKAFAGQLVEQDPDDEPASVLLDRIRTEREKAMKNNHSKKMKKRKTAA